MKTVQISLEENSLRYETLCKWSEYRIWDKTCFIDGSSVPRSSLFSLHVCKAHRELLQIHNRLSKYISSKPDQPQIALISRHYSFIPFSMDFRLNYQIRWLQINRIYLSVRWREINVKLHLSVTRKWVGNNKTLFHRAERVMHFWMITVKTYENKQVTIKM